MALCALGADREILFQKCRGYRGVDFYTPIGYHEIGVVYPMGV